MADTGDRAERVLSCLRIVVTTLEELAPIMPTTADMSDTDMALMYLRHITRHLESGNASTTP